MDDEEREQAECGPVRDCAAATPGTAVRGQMARGWNDDTNTERWPPCDPSNLDDTGSGIQGVC
jgi:hypothetical protein